MKPSLELLEPESKIEGAANHLNPASWQACLQECCHLESGFLPPQASLAQRHFDRQASR